MAKSYSDYIKTGQMDHLTAIKHNTTRNQGQAGTRDMLAAFSAKGLPADALAFGMLDTIAVNLVRWYGAEAAAEVLRHYAEVCERQTPTEGGATS